MKTFLLDRLPKHKGQPEQKRKTIKFVENPAVDLRIQIPDDGIIFSVTDYYLHQKSKLPPLNWGLVKLYPLQAKTFVKLWNIHRPNFNGYIFRKHGSLWSRGNIITSVCIKAYDPNVLETEMISPHGYIYILKHHKEAEGVADPAPSEIPHNVGLDDIK